MAASDVITRLARLGCALVAKGDALRVIDNERRLTDDLRAEIREHKVELLELLRSKPGEKTHRLTSADFVAGCCRLTPDAISKGASLILALAGYKACYGAAAKSITWQIVCEELLALACENELVDCRSMWRGVTLAERGEAMTTYPLPEGGGPC